MLFRRHSTGRLPSWRWWTSGFYWTQSRRMSFIVVRWCVCFIICGRWDCRSSPWTSSSMFDRWQFIRHTAISWQTERYHKNKNDLQREHRSSLTSSDAIRRVCLTEYINVMNCIMPILYFSFTMMLLSSYHKNLVYLYRLISMEIKISVSDETIAYSVNLSPSHFECMTFARSFLSHSFVRSFVYLIWLMIRATVYLYFNIISYSFLGCWLYSLSLSMLLHWLHDPRPTTSHTSARASIITNDYNNFVTINLDRH
jgi:hypothetical protein